MVVVRRWTERRIGWKRGVEVSPEVEGGRVENGSSGRQVLVMVLLVVARGIAVWCRLRCLMRLAARIMQMVLWVFVEGPWMLSIELIVLMLAMLFSRESACLVVCPLNYQSPAATGSSLRMLSCYCSVVPVAAASIGAD